MVGFDCCEYIKIWKFDCVLFQEASDLLDLPEESAEQIWLKHGLVRRDESAIAIADLENHQDIPSATNGLFQRPPTVPGGPEEGEADENPDRKAAGNFIFVAVYCIGESPLIFSIVCN